MIFDSPPSRAKRFKTT